MLERLLRKNGFSTELIESYTKLLKGHQYKICDIESSLLENLVELRMAIAILDRVIVYNPKATFLAWKNEILWSKGGKNIIHESSPLKHFPPNFHEKDVNELQVAAELLFSAQTIYENVVVGDGESQITNYISESVLSSYDTIRALAIDTALTNTAAVWGSLEKKIMDGVKYIRICDINEILLHGLKKEKGVKSPLDCIRATSLRLSSKQIKTGSNLHSPFWPQT